MAWSVLTLLHILPAARFSVALPTPLAFVGFFNVVRAVANRFAFRGGKVFSFYSFNLFGICPLYIYIYMVVLDCCFLWLQEWRSLGVHETYVDFRREKENRIRVSKQSNKGEGETSLENSIELGEWSNCDEEKHAVDSCTSTQLLKTKNY